MNTVGVILFAIGCLPTYLGSIHYNMYRYDAIRAKIRQSKRYDDELLYRTTTAMYDAILAREFSMERKAFFMNLKKLRKNVETRYEYYKILLERPECDPNLTSYYDRRIDEFYGVLQQIPPC